MQAEEAARAFNSAWHPRLRLLAHDCRSHSRALVRHLAAHDAFELDRLLLAARPPGPARARAAASSSTQGRADVCWDSRQVTCANAVSRGIGWQRARTSMRLGTALRAAVLMGRRERADLWRAARMPVVPCQRMHVMFVRTERHVQVHGCQNMLRM